MNFFINLFYQSNKLKLVLQLLFIFTILRLQAQPVNDNCSNAIELGKTPYCSDVLYSNLNSTPSNIGNDNSATCFVDNPPLNDVWFTFEPSIGDEELNIIIEGINVNDKILNNIQAAVYRGACFFDAMVLRDCAVSNNLENTLSFTISNLSPGEIYYLRIDNFGGEIHSGGFKICIEQRYIYNIKEDDYSNKCSGVLYDSGGDSNNYSNNEKYSFTICPENSTNQSKSIEFEFSYYHLPLINQGEFEFDTVPNPSARDGDKISIHLGQDTTFVKYLEINGNADYYFFDGLIFGGGIQYENCLNTECLTIKFISDDTLNAEGFEFKWNCYTDFCTIEDTIKLDIDTNVTNAQILDYLLIKGVNGNITNVDCNPSSLGIFENETDDIGFDKGLILSNGSVRNAIGPNDSYKSSLALHKDGDSDLDSLSAYKNPEEWVKSYDGCVVELDVTPYAEEIHYKYVFGSEEYHEFVNNDYNDIFALFISGNGIAGIPGLDGKENMALIPGTEDYVEINSVNGSKNWQYYHSNYLGKDIQYDGLVWDSFGKNHFLYARKKVKPCETYHLKYAIADRFDSIYDSGVFIGELTDGRPQLSVVNSEDLGYFIDNCDIVEGEIIISLSFPLEKDVTYDIEVSGTAEENVDYNFDIPSQIVFKAGETKKEFKIFIIEDNIKEGVEFIKIKLLRDLTCGRKEIAELNLEIHDQLDINIFPDVDTLLACKDDSINIEAFGADFFHWEPKSFIDFPDSNNINIYIEEDTWILLEGRLFDTIYDKCYGTDSVFINTNFFDFYIKGDSLKQICDGSVLEIQAYSEKPELGNISWSPKNLFIGETNSFKAKVNADSLMSKNAFIEAVYQYNGCEIKDSVELELIKTKHVEIKIEPELNLFICDTVTINLEIKPPIEDSDSVIWNLAANYWNTDLDEIMLELDRETTILDIKIIDEYGCESVSDTFFIAKEQEILFPNAIFQGDEENGVFKYYKTNACTEVLNLQVFNRWGELLYNCDNDLCGTEGWDGTYKGTPVAPGVYLFKCIIKNKKGIVTEYKGNLMVLK